MLQTLNLGHSLSPTLDGFNLSSKICNLIRKKIIICECQQPYLTFTEGEEFQPIEPVEFQDKLAEKCWNFVTEKTATIIPKLKIRRNLVVIVKVCVMGDVMVTWCLASW